MPAPLPRMISTAGVIELEQCQSNPPRALPRRNQPKQSEKAPPRERLPVPQIGQKGQRLSRWIAVGGSDCGEVMDARLWG
ncbi:hypothetical protein BDZ85DRAFT_253951 [Elsinoe ampelina]|uniref:Uncharacterized protein n=1 Tax=Elsinoe ampelina TaxID=302913 RepID=A0A6A6GNS6_9PEZI|nr:hypothetical protein BDZ85DRAFT_253951 [Elsinoe ampelina]